MTNTSSTTATNVRDWFKDTYSKARIAASTPNGQTVIKTTIGGVLGAVVGGWAGLGTYGVLATTAIGATVAHIGYGRSLRAVGSGIKRTASYAHLIAKGFVVAAIAVPIAITAAHAFRNTIVYKQAVTNEAWDAFFGLVASPEPRMTAEMRKLTGKVQNYLGTPESASSPASSPAGAASAASNPSRANHSKHAAVTHAKAQPV